MNEKINYVEFGGSNLEATKTFFRDVFSWESQDYGTDYVAFSKSGIECGFFRSDCTSKYSSGGALVVLYTENLEDVLKRIVNHGGVLVRDIFSFPGGRRFHFQEPSGNELPFGQISDTQQGAGGDAQKLALFETPLS